MLPLELPQQYYSELYNPNTRLHYPTYIYTLYNMLAGVQAATEHSKRLFEDLFSRYQKLVRPVQIPSMKAVIRFKIKLAEILDVYEKNQVLITSLWLHHEWHDYRLMWEPRHYGGVTHLYVPCQMIWTPDTILYNNVDGDYQITTMTKANISHTGTVVWEPPGIYKSQCSIDVEYFPFDQQNCELKFGLWTNDYSVADFVHDISPLYITNRTERKGTGKSAEEVSIQEVEEAVDLNLYTPSAQWSVMKVPGARHVKRYPGMKDTFLDITYSIHLRRKPLFYTTNLIVPTVAISVLSILVFYLPTDSGEKMTLCISVLIALSIFFMLLFDIIPATSLVVPLIGRYLLFTMILVAVSIAVTVIVINAHYRSPRTHRMRSWVRKLFVECLASWMQIPFALELLKTKATRTPKETSELRNVQGLQKPRFLDPALQRPKMFLLPNQEVEDLFDAPFFRRMLENVQFIGAHLAEEDAENEVVDEWRVVAMVIDRALLYVYIVVVAVGTATIIFNAPALYDTTPPLRD